MARRVSAASMTRQETMWGWAYLFFHLFLLGSILPLLNGMLAKPLNQTQLNFAFYLINFTAVLLIFRRFLWASLLHAFRHPAYFCQAVILGLAAYYACTWAITRGIRLLDPDFVNINDASIASLRWGSWELIAIGTALLTPPAEECFYRGLVFRQLYHRSRWGAYLLSMLVFAAIHVAGYLGSSSPLRLLLCFVQYLPAGLCLAWSYTKADTILAPIVIHAIINARSVWAIR